jgi:SpoVK/Ycf46/Vps4 family AAA+-type ATPase
MPMKHLADNGGYAPGFGTDKSERYVLRKTIAYLSRHLSRFNACDKEALRLVSWTLGAGISAVGSHLVRQVSDPTAKDYFEENFSEAGLDPAENADVILQVLKKLKPAAVRKFHVFLTALLEQRRTALGYRGKSNIEKSMTAVRKMFDLSDAEAEFCVFLFIAATYEEPELFFIDTLRADRFQGRKYLVNLLQVSWMEMDRILHKLKNIGLIDVDSRNFEYDRDFLSQLQNPAVSDFSKHLYRRIPKASLPLKDHFISADIRNHLLGLLRNRPRTATNLLFYGPPGTGKTALAQGLVRETGVTGYEIARNEINDAFNRRAALVACLNRTAVGSGSIIVVDEADNLLNTRFAWLSRGETQDKGWLNKILEQPGTRIIWITNQIDDIEDSVLRRFAFSLRFKPFNRRQRIQLWDRVLRQNRVKRFFSPPEIEALAGSYKTSAGAIDLAVKKAIELSAGSKQGLLKSIRLSLTADQTLQNRGLKKADKDDLQGDYSLGGLNLDADPDTLLQQLKRFDRYLRRHAGPGRTNFNLLFYGPPGTGKSEFARFVANAIDRELVCKRYSDIQSPFVGMGERALRAAFEEAEAESAVLVIDEVDSFLFPRDRAGRSWETTFTNEFLTGMEGFRGILIGTTNCLTDLDAAAVRRFNHKIGFDYLTPEGNRIFYAKLLEPRVGTALDRASRAALGQITHLAPGDFKIVRDRFAFYPARELSHGMLIAALAAEARIKKVHSGTKTIGFA